MRLNFITLVCGLLLLSPPNSAWSQCGTCEYPTEELVVNGNFAQGDVEFYSDYNGDPNPGPGLPPLWDAGTYQVGNNAGDFHWDFDGYAYAPFPFFGNFMVINGSNVNGANVWCQDIPVVPGGEYTFSMWVQSVVTQNPALLQVQINGEDVGDEFSAPANLNNWQNHTASWTAPEDVLMASVCITNVNTTVGGNDFGLDALSFTGCEPYLIQNVANAGPDTTICSGQSLVLGTTPAGNVSYAWQPNPHFNNLNIANPEITIENNSEDPAEHLFILESDSAGLGCLSVDSVRVTVLPQPQPELPDVVETCNFPLELSSGITNAEYLWSNGLDTESIEVAEPGDYSVVVNLDGCEGTAQTTVQLIDFESVNLGSDVVVCNLPVTLNAQIDNADYLWNTGEVTQTISATQTGEYWVTLTHNGCESSDTVMVSVDSYISFSLGDEIETCAFPIEIEAPIDNANYAWNNGQNTATATIEDPGWVVLEIEQDGCSGVDSVLVTQIQFETVDLGDDLTVCALPITLSSDIVGESYTWSSGENTPEIEADEPGLYTLTVVQNGCASTDEINVTVDSEIPLDLGQDLTVCEFPVTIESPVDGVNYLWSNGSVGSSVTVTEPGTISLEIELDGCTGYDEIEVNLFVPSPANLPEIIESCNAPVSVSTNLQNTDFLWSTGDQGNSTDVSETGWVVLDYWQNGCPASDSTYVLIENLFEIDLESTLDVCSFPHTFDAQVEADEHSWSNGNEGPVLVAENPGTYTLTATLDGCTGTASININQIPFNVAQMTDTVTVCELPVTLNSGVTGADSYTWSEGSQSATISVDAPGNYSVEVIDNSCPSSAETFVYVHPQPQIVLSTNTRTICEGESTVLSPQVLHADEYFWDHEEEDLSATITESGVYTLTVENFCGSSSRSVEVIAEDCNYSLFIPNAFTPNADGINDLFEVVAHNFTSTELWIYARNGRQVFYSSDMENEKWNGHAGGEQFYSGPTVMIYQFRGKTLKGRVIERNGIITVVR